MHRDELVIELRKQDTARRLELPEQRADERNRLAGVGKLPAKDDRQAKPDQQEDQTCQRVLKPDDCVIEEKRYFRNKPVWIL